MTKTLQWPARGYSGPQPWDLDALGVSPTARDQLLRDPGSPNTLTPTITHQYPILTSGSADPVVHELGRKLGKLGFSNSASEGRNPFGLVDQTVMSAVKSFRHAYGIVVDASGFAGSQALADEHIDPWTVEAILRATA
jgi:hypothetical protein